MAAYFGAHVLLAVAAQRFWPIATIWALATLMVGFAALTRAEIRIGLQSCQPT